MLVSFLQQNFRHLHEIRSILADWTPSDNAREQNVVFITGLTWIVYIIYPACVLVLAKRAHRCSSLLSRGSLDFQLRARMAPCCKSKEALLLARRYASIVQGIWLILHHFGAFKCVHLWTAIMWVLMFSSDDITTVNVCISFSFKNWVDNINTGCSAI